MRADDLPVGSPEAQGPQPWFPQLRTEEVEPSIHVHPVATGLVEFVSKAPRNTRSPARMDKRYAKRVLLVRVGDTSLDTRSRTPGARLLHVELAVDQLAEFALIRRQECAPSWELESMETSQPSGVGHAGLPCWALHSPRAVSHATHPVAPATEY